MITQTTTETELKGLETLLHDLQQLPVHFQPHRDRRGAQDGALFEGLRRAQLDGTRFLTYRTEGVARGYLAWTALPVGSLARLDHVYVMPILRRRGVASRLIARFEQEIAGAFDGWVVAGPGDTCAARGLMARYGARAPDCTLR
ncbi:GNAT family N-acetyltransferase [Primorskyibacter sp. 2E107]|uniref:GNAT family N-acetyltransferase n=1 Tax=Primorskyibacter sp. 2E107 TaxID=3403458 RepID=UPI003AF8E923